MNSEPSFSMQILQQLRADGYRPRAWKAMFAASWRQARVTAQAHPGLAHDWNALARAFCAATCCMTALTARRNGWKVAFRGAPLLMAATLTQASDIYVHLGLHRDSSGSHYSRLGLANVLTAARGWIGGWIGSRLLTGMPLADDELLFALALIVLTDLADGPLARRSHQASPLGRYLDGEADLGAWTMLTLTQIRRGELPSWFALAYGLRWGAPLALGLGRTFATANPVVLDSSPLARAAGTSQVALSLAAILASLRARRPDARRWTQLRKGLLAMTSVLLGMTTVRHVLRLLDS